jgi:2-polyprenyl-6-methoxyphenol hydroxylase-like FAD-dependent oxidoreductase
MTNASPTKKVAIIGTGLAGLTTAYLLQNDDQHRYSVTVFEQVSMDLSRALPCLC